MPLDFSKHLDVEVESVDAPRAPPIGHYLATFKSWKGQEVVYDKESGKKTPTIVVTFALDEPLDDVDTSELPEDGVRGKTVQRNYDLDDPDKRGLFALRKMGEETMNLPIKGLHFTDLLDAMRGQQVKLYMEQRAGKEEGEFYPKIGKILPAE
jgi:hypothetical protein